MLGAKSASWPDPAPASWRRLAATCARLAACTVYMGAVDAERRAPNVGRMQLLGASVVPVTGGDQTLRAAIDGRCATGSLGPTARSTCWARRSARIPYPYRARARAVIGREARAQFLRTKARCPTRCSPASAAARGDRHVPSVRADRAVQIVGVGAGGRHQASAEPPHPGLCRPGRAGGSCCCCRTDDSQIQRPTRSREPRLPGVGPEHALLAMTAGRVQYEVGERRRRRSRRWEYAPARGSYRRSSSYAFFGVKRWARTPIPGARDPLSLGTRRQRDMPTLQRTVLK